MNQKRKTKVVCTIGPVSEKKEMMRKLIDNGMNIIRLNFSHGDHQEQGARIETLRELTKETGKNFGVF
jgi:pyruvate kinase